MIWIILLGGMVQGAFAQNLEIKGMVRDARNKEILEFANVVLQTMDSSFVAGTTTDMKGHFLLNKIKKGSYILSVSSLGFKTEYISLESLSKNISLGEIRRRLGKRRYAFPLFLLSRQNRLIIGSSRQSCGIARTYFLS